MYRSVLLLVFIITGMNTFAGSEIILPANRFDSRFLIVIDRRTYTAAKTEILDYKSVLENEGLGVVILVGEWDNPLSLRTEIKGIYNQKPVLEGAVFVGKIPVVRIQNFQHATSAFKMDEANFPIADASVTSDRYYDDLDLEFELIRQDTTDKNQFYFRLRENSPQVIQSDFYSARMMPPSTMGVEPILLLKKYLRKVIEAHRDKTALDQVVLFNGNGYNSDCLTAWQNEQFAIREQIPLAFKSSKGNGFYNFRQDPVMKYKLFDKLQQKETDLFIFHEHGDFDTQYINGDYPAPNMIEYSGGKTERLGPLNIMAISLRNTYRRYRGEKASEFKRHLISDYGFAEEFFDKQRLDSLRVKDSIFAADKDISLEDLLKVKMQPRFTILDACYNGSFHKPGYVAGYHVFGDGNTVVAQGNTVNVLQDKVSLELVGMLAEGARVGFWQKEVQFLESHLTGDPTYHFYSEGSGLLNKQLATGIGNRKIWESYLLSKNPNLQSLALKQLSKSPPKDFSGRLLTIFKNSTYYSVRLEALKRLLDNSNENMVEAIRSGLDDPYEFIRRIAARYAGYSGDPSLIPPLVNTLIFSNESQRVQYAARTSLQVFETDAVIKEIEKQTTDSKEFTDYYKDQSGSKEKSLKTILDRSAKVGSRISAVRGLRNYNNHQQVESLLDLLRNPSENPEVRINLAEALGWFNWSIKKADILKALQDIYADTTTPQELRNELLQSINRLQGI